jgi:DNA repair ATPase RecN
MDSTSDTEKKLNGEISSMITLIANTYPELSKFIDEMPVPLSYKKSDAIHVKNLEKYLESLKNLISKYGVTHPPLKVKTQKK